MIDIPKRFSLVAQTADAVRKGIEDKVWEEVLPGERRLCAVLQVSRPTVQAALRLLAEDGWLEIRQGRPNRIRPGRTVRTRSRRNRRIAFIVNEPLTAFTFSAYQTVSEIRALLAEHDFSTEILVCQSHSVNVQLRKLKAFLGENRFHACLLTGVSRELQEWMAASSIPALVLGSCHPGVKLPSMDMDFRSVCRHAAGVFLSKGHRRLAFVTPDSGWPGDAISEVGFREAVDASGTGATAIIVRHNGSGRSIASRLDAVFNVLQPPTALLVTNPQHLIKVIISLLNRGVKVPETVSLISRDDDYVYKLTHPPIAHYAYMGAFENRAIRLIMQLVDHGRLPLEPSLIFPQYIPGATVRRLD